MTQAAVKETIEAAPVATIEWPEPKPIRAPLNPVAAFDAETLLPDALREWIVDEADRMPCPPDYIAVAAMATLGSIVGARCAIKPKSRDDWMVVPNLWGGIVGPPSAKKSPAINAALKPLDRLITKAKEAHGSELEVYETEKMVFEVKKDAIEYQMKTAAKNKKQKDLNKSILEIQTHRKQAPNKPVPRRFKSNDTTIEKLGELLRENPTGILIHRDELVGLIASWDKEGREGDRTFYLEGWNGIGSYDADRIGRGSISIPNHCISVFGGIQPDKLTVYLEQAANALANDGMLQRFQLLVFPDHRMWEWRNREPSKTARDKAFAVFNALADFDPVSWGAKPADDLAKFPHFHFDDEAQQIFIEWSADLHQERLPAEEHPIIQQHLAKYDKLFPALALIFHLIDCATLGHKGAITAAAALRAAAWCDYLETHARRCYGLLIDDGLRAAQALADKIRRGKLLDNFTARDVRRNQWRYLTTDEVVQAALDWLESEGWLRAVEHGGTGQGTGRRTWRYLINPKVAKLDQSEGNHAKWLERARREIPKHTVGDTAVAAIRTLSSVMAVQEPPCADASPVSIVSNGSSSKATFPKKKPVIHPVKAVAGATIEKASSHVEDNTLEWSRNLATLCTMPRPAAFTPKRWQQIIEDGQRFLKRWGKDAVALGWCATDLFGCSPNSPDQYNGMGLVPTLMGRDVVRMTDDRAWILYDGNVHVPFRRQNIGSKSKPLWSLACAPGTEIAGSP